MIFLHFILRCFVLFRFIMLFYKLICFVMSCPVLYTTILFFYTIFLFSYYQAYFSSNFFHILIPIFFSFLFQFFLIFSFLAYVWFYLLRRFSHQSSDFRRTFRAPKYRTNRFVQIFFKVFFSCFFVSCSPHFNDFFWRFVTVTLRFEILLFLSNVDRIT